MNASDRLAEELQATCDADAVHHFGEAVVARWKAPRHMGVMFAPSTTVQVGGACGDSITIFLRIEGEHIIEASFSADGCGSSVVCTDAAMELVRGMTLDTAATLDAATILERLGGLPKDKEKSARVAARAVRQAVEDFRKRA
ncbi:iron-sulfur cluster assembly scaffold protein [Desulfolutivibrio sulfoxidireducens]|uniref:iron-sulfur cluster assembly scaffold protein n=1 Tax=Desulfolutivibrio sulfoxidireducens TaxID=2773299 RepID=UPI00159E37CC|nr:iron-sulfur cluster assembly scaffold protein [Desulfolutivibrio sulfoxidireducens]QLA16141.1 iron-sulfur cluster assembly scaffold protein [Desulfolutivibrio sulfoxidireducens]QLA19962.1 iron-sulfur cluster assembly scaffold protein [Desulfolutivibrio sulfoxidireducens]